MKTNHNAADRNERIAALISFFLLKNPGSGRTQIVKFLYLTDLEYRQYQGRPVTDLDYIWGDHGPFDKRIYEVLDSMKDHGYIREEAYQTSFGKPAFRYELAKGFRRDGLHRAEIEIAEHIATQVRDTPLRALLDDVVYQTAPMLDAKKRDAHGQNLNMDLVNLEKRKFGLDLEEAWEGAESLAKGQGIPADELFNELLSQCPQ